MKTPPIVCASDSRVSWLRRIAQTRTAALLLAGGVGFIAASSALPAEREKDDPAPIRIGYFHGGRTALLLRAYDKNAFAGAGLNVEIYSKKLREKEYSLAPRSIQEYVGSESMVVGKATGLELIDGIIDGKFEMATVGEGSFIQAISEGKPVVAIAELAHDVAGRSGHVFLIRKGVSLEKPEDYRGKVLITRRAGPIEIVMLKEYLTWKRVDLAKDVLELPKLPASLEEKARLPKNKVIVVGSVFEDDLEEGIQNGVIDGGYFHVMKFEMVASLFDLVHPLHDWINPELSHALLICHKDFLADNTETLVRILKVYLERIRHEHGLSDKKRTQRRIKGLQIAMDSQNLNYPQNDPVPIVDIELLYEIKRLLVKYGNIQQPQFRIEDYVDNRFVLQAAEELGIKEFSE
jgi:ABC-type nitrate/sulfonate/bicarbonate transport system substrate-binding protein